MNSGTAQELIQSTADRWKDYTNLPETTLLRMFLLRDLIQNLHSHKSHCLAKGLKNEVQMIKSWETQIESLRDNTHLKEDLMQLLQNAAAPLKRKRLLPEALFQVIEREKLQRYDRQWEAALAFEAITLKWTFWKLEAWLEIPFIDEWSTSLAQKLWPHGLILFYESAMPQTSSPSPTLSDSSEQTLWCGRWYVLLNHHFKHPEELSLYLDRNPGLPQNTPNPCQWKYLFP